MKRTSRRLGVRGYLVMSPGVRASLCVLQWMLAYALLALAWNLKDPHLLAVRHIETPVLLVLALLGAVLGRRRRPGPGRSLLRGLFMAAVALIPAGEWTFHHRKIAVLHAEPAMAAALGRHFVVGYDTLDEARPLVTSGLAGRSLAFRR